MTDADKLEKLFAIVTLAFLFSYAWGCQLRKMQKARAATKRKSTFRLGLENMLRLLSNPHLKEKERRDFTDWLKLPIYDSIFVV